MAEDLTVGHPSYYRGSGLVGRPLFAPNVIPNQGTPYLSAGNQPMTQFGDAMRGYSLYQLPTNYVSATAAQPATQAVPMYLNRNAPPYDPMGVFDRYRNMASGLAPAAAAAAVQSVTQPVEQQVPEATVPQAAQVEAPQSVMSVESLPRTAMPTLQPKQNNIRYIESQGVDALDGPAAAADFGRRYAAVAASGAVPVLSEAMLEAFNRQNARSQAALSAATKARDVNDMYAAMGDPNLRARAQALSQANGISFDLAMKQALQSMLLERGEHNLANRYEMQNVLPAINAEQQNRIVDANEFGGNAVPIRGVYGEDILVPGINYLHTNADGSRTITTPFHKANVSQGAVTTYNAIHGSNSPVTSAFNIDLANRQTLLNAQQAVAHQVNASREQIAKDEKTAIAALGAQLNGYAQLAKASAQMQNAGTRASQVDSNSMNAAIRNATQLIKTLPPEHPARQQAEAFVSGVFVSPTDPNAGGN